MAVSVAAAFEEFKARLELTTAQAEDVKRRKELTREYLYNAFPATGVLPLRVAHLVGSAGRGTIIRPLDDIDVLAVFDNKERMFERLYANDSTKFLYRVREALNQYKVQIVGARGQAVRLFYSSAPHVDIAPVFEWADGGYALPDGSGGWLRTDPLAHDRWMQSRVDLLGSRIKPLVKMLKRWNREHGKHMGSFHIEVMAASMFASLSYKSPENCTEFFANAPSWLSVQDPAGHGGDLSRSLNFSDRIAINTAFESARQRAVKANAAEVAGDHAESIRLWRVVFGGEFPAYG